MSLTEALVLYRDSDIYPFHMPGHKRNMFVLNSMFDYGMDITEIDGFDDLHNPNGILKKQMALAAELYGSKKTFFLVNGSTCGILAGISAVAERGSRVLVARNCHNSVYHAIKINGLIAEYIVPPIDNNFGINGSITPESVYRSIKNNPDISLVIITSPTYDGVISDISAIADIVHKFNIPLFVDEAHGAHLGLSDFLPKNAVQLGADIVVHSLHKTLPSPTQTALLHINRDIVDAEHVQRMLSVYQTSSPSYLLMAGIDSCIELLLKQGDRLFSAYKKRLDDFYNRTKKLRKFSIVKKTDKFFDFDYGRIVISAKDTDMSGTQLKNILLDSYLLQLEAANEDYAIALTSVCDTDRGFSRLYNALLELDSSVNKSKENKAICKPIVPDVVHNLDQAEEMQGFFTRLPESKGEVSAEYIYEYPPGIPLVVPGERITKSVLEYIDRKTVAGIKLNSTYNGLPEKIKIIK